MGRYTPTIKLDRRRRLAAPNNLDVVRTAMLGVFMILLAFFVALVANTKPNDQKTIDVLATLQKTFQPANGDIPMTAPAIIPQWLQTQSKEGIISPLEELKRDFSGTFSSAQNNWGALELRFTPDMFQSFILTRGDLAKRLFSGLTDPLDISGASDPFVLTVNIGGDNPKTKTAQRRYENIRRNLLSFGIHPSRLIMGYESGTKDIIVRMIPASRYGGIL